MPKLSKRAQDVPQSDIRKFVPLADAARARGVKVYPLNIGQPDIKSPKLFLDELKNLDIDIVAYEKSRGNDRLVRATRDYYNRTLDLDLDIENVQITAGGSEAILFSLLTICNPGDEVVTFEPFFVNNIGNAYKAAIKFVPVATVAENGFQIPRVADMEHLITDKTKAILICNPNNPTGTAYPDSVMEEYVRFAEQHKIFLLVDEVYRDFVYDRADLYTSLRYKSRNVVVIDSFSVVAYEPEGAFYIVVKLPIEDANHFITWMLNEFSYDGGTVFVSPASGFYITPDTGKNEIRIAYVINCNELKRAMKVLEMGLQEYNKLIK